MFKTKKIELTSKLVVALIAVVAVSAMISAPVLAQQGGPPVRDNSVTSASIRDGEVRTQDLADGAVTNPKLSDNAVTTEKIEDGTIQEEDLAEGVGGGGGGALPNIHIVEGQLVPIREGQNGVSATASCPTGEKLTGGGFTTSLAENLNGPEIYATHNAPQDEDTWFVTANNLGTVGNQNGALTAFVICMGPPPSSSSSAAAP